MSLESWLLIPVFVQHTLRSCSRAFRIRKTLPVFAVHLPWPLYVCRRFTYLPALRTCPLYVLGCFTFLAGKFGWPRERFEDKFTTLRIAWVKLRHPKGYLNMVRREIGLETESKSSCGRGRQLAIAEHGTKKRRIPRV